MTGHDTETTRDTMAAYTLKIRCACGWTSEANNEWDAKDRIAAHLSAVKSAEVRAMGPAELFDKIRAWANARNLIAGSTPEKQFLKLMEEIGETAGAQARGQLDKVKDGIGDAVVCLVILAAQKGLAIEDCIAFAYDEIKDRKGRMVDGIFIKESE